MSSVCCTGVTRPVPGITKWGLYKSTDRGASWSFIHNGSASTAQCTGDLTEFNNLGICSPRGVRNVLLDPSNPEVVYATSYARGVWRSNDGGANWTQIEAAEPGRDPDAGDDRRQHAGERRHPHVRLRGQQWHEHLEPVPQRQRADGSAGVDRPDEHERRGSGWGTTSNCDPQCWYDQFIYTPKGHPDIVYVGGDYSYGETIANKRGVVLSTDAGVTTTDMTFDGTDPLHPNGLHPDQHDLVTVPGSRSSSSRRATAV